MGQGPAEGERPAAGSAVPVPVAPAVAAAERSAVRIALGLVGLDPDEVFASSAEQPAAPIRATTTAVVKKALVVARIVSPRSKMWNQGGTECFLGGVPYVDG